MKRFWRGSLAAIAILCAAEARADSLDYSVTSSGWTQVGSAGQSIRVQAQGNAVILSTSASAPTTTAGPLIAPAGPPDCLNLTQNLWAQVALYSSGATVKTETGVTCSAVMPTAFVDRSSSTSVTPGAFTQVAAANAGRQYLRITNTSTAVEYVWDKGGTPSQAGSIPIQPGQQMVWDSKVSAAAIQIMSPAASSAYEGAEG